MYLRHFGLKQLPFSIAPDPRYLFMSERHREALAHLLYGVRGNGGFVVLTGDIGAGKTTVCRCLLEQLPERVNVAYIFNPKLTVDELLRAICAEFRIPTPHQGPGAATVKDHVDALNEYLLRMHAVRQNNVLIIDEAQNLSPEVLEQLRLLTNLETHERKLLQIVLIGQPELRTMLAQPGLQQLAQRVIARYHLSALSEEETVRYVRHRLAVAGLSQPLPFESAALKQVFGHSRGVPRRINLLCDRALLGAYAKGLARVDQATLQKAAQEVFDDAPPAAAAARRSGWQRPVLIGAGVLAGVVLFSVALLAADRARRAEPRHEVAAAAQPAPDAAASAPVAAGSTQPVGATATDAAPALPPVFDLRTGFAALAGAEPAAWGELARAWSVGLGDGDPCAQAIKQQMRCFRSGNATLALIRQIDRPGVLTLRDAGNRPAFLMLSGLTDDAALVRVDGTLRAVPLLALADYWRGEYATLWRVPPQYAGGVVDSRSGAAAQWLAQKLADARGDGRPLPPRVDAAALKAWVHTFQLTQGLPSDGVAGPVTLMQLNRATGVAEPRLQGAR